MPRPPWHRATGLDGVVSQWLASQAVRPCFTDERERASEAGETVPFPATLHGALRGALVARGVTGLYLHQAQAFEAARAHAGARHVVVSTPTASGKSLCFHLPVLDAIARAHEGGEEAAALYLYPTKALSRDQEAGLRELVAAASLQIPAIVYDGDTPGDARRSAREKSAVVMTNPDMLHASILPHHAQWARTFQRLRYVVLDELHTYRGVFGSHVAHVIERLRRIAAFHGSYPTFLCATATIGNPREHTARLLGVPASEVELVDRSTAPRGRRRFFVYNPPVVNAELGVRASYLKSAVRLAADLVRAGVATIVFGPSRNSVELLVKYLREETSQARPGQPAVPESALMAYRGGYLPDTRRRIERDLREGKILGVAATNALELGIDIGALDAVICAGWPGSLAALWQRFGRAGRRGAESACVLVASSAPIDQYLAGNPETLFSGDVEHARIDPTNTEILVQHLKCAAFELPFRGGDAYARLPGHDTVEALRYLADGGVLHETRAADGEPRFHWATEAYPATHVSLRTVGWDNFVIVDRTGESSQTEGGRVLGELDFRATHTMLHEQAIYQHDGEQYQVERLDFENHKAFVRKVDPDYFTTALVHAKVRAHDVAAERTLPDRARQGDVGAHLAFGEVSVVEKVTGYKKVKFFTHENTGYGDVRLPDMQMHTTALWLRVPDAPSWGPIHTDGEYEPDRLGKLGAVEALRGLGALLEVVSCLALMCDPRDLGRAIEDEDPDAAPRPDGVTADFDPVLFLYDQVPGGVGLAERMFERFDELLARARELAAGCACEAGCPSCVGPAAHASAGRKGQALVLLDHLLGHALGDPGSSRITEPPTE
jgi:DEAD/DEAH box helicase domain-containing protein